MSESKVRCRKNRKYGTMKNEKRTTIQLSHEVKEYLQSEAKRLKISFSEAIEMLGFIYLTHMLRRAYIFLAVTGLFALFLLLSVRSYARSGVGPRPGVSRSAALTLSPVEQAIWLPLSVHTHPRDVQGVLPEYEARSLTALKWMPKSSAFTSKTKQHSLLKSIQSTSFTQSYQTGERETCAASNNGQQCEVNRLCSDGRNAVTTQTTEPAEKRVLLSGDDVEWLIARFMFVHSKGAAARIVGAAICCPMGLPESVIIGNLPLKGKRYATPHYAFEGLTVKAFNKSLESEPLPALRTDCDRGQIGESAFFGTRNSQVEKQFNIYSACASRIFEKENRLRMWSDMSLRISEKNSIQQYICAFSKLQSHFGGIGAFLCGACTPNSSFSRDVASAYLMPNQLALSEDQAGDPEVYKNTYSSNYQINGEQRGVQRFSGWRYYVNLINPICRILLFIVLIGGGLFCAWYASILTIRWWQLVCAILGGCICSTAACAILYDWMFRLYRR